MDEVPDVFPLLCQGIVKEETTKDIFAVSQLQIYHWLGDVQCPATLVVEVVIRSMNPRKNMLANVPAVGRCMHSLERESTTEAAKPARVREALWM